MAKKVEKIKKKKEVKPVKKAAKKAVKIPLGKAVKASNAAKVKTPKEYTKDEKKSTSEEVGTIPADDKKKIIAEFAIKTGDTGSPEVQVALLTHKIEKLVSHLKANPKDNHSRRGLLGMVSKRRRLLTYLSKKAQDRYKDIIKKLNLAK